MRCPPLLACALAFLLMALAPHARAGSPEVAEPPHASLRFNPLALVIGRTSGDVEVWVTEHVSVVGTMFRASFREDGGSRTINQGDPNQTTETTASSRLSLVGFEVGVRYTQLFAMSRAIQLGPFGGAAVGPAWGRWRTQPGSAGGVPTSDRITQLTVAAEVGAMMRAGPLVLDVGVGLQGTENFGPDPSVDCGQSFICVSTTHWFYGGGFTPRVLTSIGFAF